MNRNRSLIASAYLLSVFVLVQMESVRVFGQKAPRTIEFSNMRDHLDEYKLRRGDIFVVPSVPFTGVSVYEKVNKIYSLRAGDTSDYGYYYWFHTSPTLAKSLRQRLNEGDELSVHVYCTLVEFVDGDYVNQAPFVTKAEGFDGHGRLVWTVAGPQPAKLKMSQ